MNASNMIKGWNTFKQNLDSLLRAERLVMISYDNNLATEYFSKDINEMLDLIDSSLRIMEYLIDEIDLSGRLASAIFTDRSMTESFTDWKRVNANGILRNVVREYSRIKGSFITSSRLKSGNPVMLGALQNIQKKLLKLQKNLLAFKRQHRL